MRRCGRCGLKKALSEFYNNITSPDGHSWLCKNCTNNYARDARIGMYGITKEQFNFLLVKQDHRCAICQNLFTKENIPIIDHNHSCCPARGRGSRLSTRCGKCVRGILCRSCNVGLGMFSDNAQRMLSAIKYLQNEEIFDYMIDVVSLEGLENLLF